MPKVSKEQASQVESAEGFEGHYEELGGYTVGFETHTADADLAPFFKGLPDDRCQSPHWGYVFKGKIVYRYDSGDETYEAGEAYYARPGHVPYLYEGTEIVEFSPTEELQKTMEVFVKNAQSAPVS